MSGWSVLTAFVGAVAAPLVVLWPWPSSQRRALELEATAAPERRGLTAFVVSGVDRVGHALRRSARRAQDPEADRRVGTAVVGGLVAAAVHPVLGLLAAVAPHGRHVWITRRRRRCREEQIVRELPDVVDLFRIAAGGGLTVRQAVDAVDGVVDEPFANGLHEVLRDVSFGERLGDALTSLNAELGEPARPLVAALVSAERDGAPLREPLERVAWIARDLRRRRAEETARRVPVQLLFPLVACVLPAFALLTVVPLLAGALRTLSL